MCGMPRDAILYFSRQDVTDGDKKRNDCTLGKYLEELAETAKVKCAECHFEKYMHSQEIYHRDGQIQITIKPQLQNAMQESQGYGKERNMGASGNSQDMNFNERHQMGNRQ